MTMLAGSATAHDDGTATGTGLAYEFASAYIPLVLANYTSDQQTAAVKKGVAKYACDLGNALATAVVGHLTANAVIDVHTYSLGKLPATLTPGTDIDPIGGFFPVTIPLQ
jgi:hypothetical protein